MADTRNKISYFLEQVQRWLPYIIQDETQKQRQKQELENALRKILAGGEEERKTKSFGTGEDIVKSLFDPSYFNKLNLPAQQALAQLVKIYPQLIQEKGIQVPPNLNQEIENASAVAWQAEKDRMGGNFPTENIGQAYSGYFGPEMMEKLASGASAVSETAKERPLEERRVVVEEKKLPLEERKVAVSERESTQRRKEFEAGLKDMTPKSARDILLDFDKERRGNQKDLAKKTDAWGEPLSEDQLRGLKSNIDELKWKASRIEKKFPQIWNEPDEFGFKFGEIRTSPRGRARYVGNNQWELVD